MSSDPRRTRFAVVSGALIRRMRMEAGANMTVFSQALGLHVGKLSQLENGLREVSLYEFLEIARTANVPVVEALGRLRRELR